MDLGQAWGIVAEAGNALGRFINGPFMAALLSALAGAFAGVLGAQKLALREARKAELAQDFRHSSAAITLSFTLCNNVLAAKKQYINPLTEKYESDRSAALDGIARASRGEGPINLHFQALLTKFPVSEFPTDAIKNLVYGKSHLNGRGLALIAMLEQSVAEFREALSTRNALIDEFAQAGLEESEFHRRYFGLKDGRGHTYHVFPDVVDAVHSYSNDVAFFSALLTEDLIEHCEKLSKKLKKDFRHKTPKVSTVDFSGARSAGLIPPPSDYESWLSGFAQHPENAP